MLVVFPTYAGDIKQLQTLLEWIADLSPSQPNQALIMTDQLVPFNEVLEAKRLAEKGFSKVTISAIKSRHGWPHGANDLWRAAANYVWNQGKQEPWLWMEPDAVPLKDHWLRTIEAIYQSSNKAFLGHIYSCSQNGLPSTLMSGVAVYPYGAIRMVKTGPESTKAWDVESAEIMVSQGQHTDLIHHLWGEKQNPPTFKYKAVPGTNVFSLKQIKPNAVIFHRNKDGTLINLLRDRYKLTPSVRNPFVVVLPFCNKDAQEQFENLRWQRDLGGSSKFECLLSFEERTSRITVENMIELAKETYGQVHVHKYTNSPNQRWPDGPNWAFQNTVLKMRDMKKAWLWMESDMKALTKNWLQTLQEEYAGCGKAIMGSVVPTFGHLNGTSIYPFDLDRRCPKIMQVGDKAFDTCSISEMLADHHNAIHLLSHCWGEHLGKPHPHLGEPVIFYNQDKVKQFVPVGAVTFHRAKGNSLIERLRERL